MNSSVRIGIRKQIRVPQCDSESVSSRQRARGSLKRTAAGPAASRFPATVLCFEGRNRSLDWMFVIWNSVLLPHCLTDLNCFVC